jgi:hypothetical protein
MTLFPQPIYNFTAKSAAYTASNGDYVLGTAAAAWVLTLPPVSNGAFVGVRKVDSAAFAITVKTADGSTIDGVTGTTGLATATSQHSGWEFASDGTNWFVVGT